MSKSIKYIYAISLIGLAIVFGFFRDSFAVDINETLFKHQLYATATPIYWVMHSKYEIYQLITYKWLMTGLSILIIFFITYLVTGLIFFFSTSQFLILIRIYGLLILMAVAGTIIGKLFGEPMHGYLVSRRLLGILQSVIIIFIAITVFVLYQHKESE